MHSNANGAQQNAESIKKGEGKKSFIYHHYELV